MIELTWASSSSNHANAILGLIDIKDAKYLSSSEQASKLSHWKYIPSEIVQECKTTASGQESTVITSTDTTFTTTSQPPTETESISTSTESIFPNSESTSMIKESMLVPIESAFPATELDAVNPGPTSTVDQLHFAEKAVVDTTSVDSKQSRPIVRPYFYWFYPAYLITLWLVLSNRDYLQKIAVAFALAMRHGIMVFIHQRVALMSAHFYRFKHNSPAPSSSSDDSDSGDEDQDEQTIDAQPQVGIVPSPSSAETTPQPSHDTRSVGNVDPQIETSGDAAMAGSDEAEETSTAQAHAGLLADAHARIAVLEQELNDARAQQLVTRANAANDNAEWSRVFAALEAQYSSLEADLQNAVAKEQRTYQEHVDLSTRYQHLTRTVDTLPNTESHQHQAVQDSKRMQTLLEQGERDMETALQERDAIIATQQATIAKYEQGIRDFLEKHPQSGTEVDATPSSSTEPAAQIATHNTSHGERLRRALALKEAADGKRTQ